MTATRPMGAGQRSSRFRLYTSEEAKGTLGSTKTTWSSNREEWGGMLPAYMTLRNFGAGEVPTGTREIEFRAPSQVDERIGLEVTAGLELGTKWRVVSVDRSRRSIVMARVEPFNGVFA